MRKKIEIYLFSNTNWVWMAKGKLSTKWEAKDDTY